MKDRKFLILIPFSLFILFLILFFTRPLRIPAQISLPPEPEERIRDREIIRALVEINVSLKDDLEKLNSLLEKEKDKTLRLEDEIKKISSEREALTSELNQARLVAKELEDITSPIKTKLMLINKRLETEGFSPKQLRSFRKQLLALGRQLNSIDYDIQVLIQKAEGYKPLAEDLKEKWELNNEALKLAKKELKEIILDRDSLKKELLSSLNRLKDTEQKKLELEKNLNELEKRDKLFTKRIRELEEDLEKDRILLNRLSQERQALIREKEELSRIKSSLETEISNLSEELRLKDSQLEKTNLEYINLRLEFDSKSQLLSKNESELAKRLEMILRLQEEQKRLQEEQKRLQEEREKLMRDLEAQTVEMARLREKVVAEQMEKQRLRLDLDQANLEVMDLRRRLKKIQDLLTGSSEVTETPKKIEVEIFSESSIEEK